MWICSPNNPTGGLLHPEDIIRLLDSLTVWWLSIEAYVGFSLHILRRSMCLTRSPQSNCHANFSKAWGMASLRMGLAFASPEDFELFARVKYPIMSTALLRKNCCGEWPRPTSPRKSAEIVGEHASGLRAVGHAEGEKVHHSDASFLPRGQRRRAMYDYLIGHGVVVRNRSRVDGFLGSCLRFTVGTPLRTTR